MRTLKEIIRSYNSYVGMTEDFTRRGFKFFRSYSCESIEKIMCVDGYEIGLQVDIDFGDFNQYTQEIIQFDVNNKTIDYCIIAVNIEDFVPNIFSEIAKLETLDLFIKEVTNEFVELIRILRNKYEGTILVCTFIPPMITTATTFNTSNQNGINNVVNRINMAVKEIITDMINIHTIELEEVIKSIGTINLYDYKMMNFASNPYTIHFYSMLSTKIFEIVKCLEKPRKKCIVVDLDNTIWGGIVGEDGVEGLVLDFYYKSIQQLLLQYSYTGIVLAICSKNNEDDVREVFDKRSEMVLKTEHFVATRINWNNKVDNIKSIAKELNLGLDSFIFIDDSEYECEFVRKEIPEVETICLNGSMESRLMILSRLQSINLVKLTKEDRSKTNSYLVEKKRSIEMSKYSDLDSYLKDLDIQVRVDFGDKINIERVSQLTLKTNQFNLTNRRYAVSDLLTMIDQGYKIYAAHVTDKFGEYGIVGVVIVKELLQIWEIDTFLLSCRVLKRNVERKLFAFILEKARENNVNLIKGFYSASNKNIMVKNLYSDFGFDSVADEWFYNTSNDFTDIPYIKVINNEVGDISE